MILIAFIMVSGSSEFTVYSTFLGMLLKSPRAVSEEIAFVCVCDMLVPDMLV